MSKLRQSYGRIAEGNRYKDLVPVPFIAPITDDGTATGSPNMAVLATLGSPIEFWIQPPKGTVFQLLDTTLLISDMGSLSQTSYGNLPMLPNGIEFTFEFNGTRTPVFAPVQSNAQIFGPITSIDEINYSGGVRVRKLNEAYFNFSEGITLNGDTNDKLVAKLQDDLTGLNTHAIFVKGQFWKTSF